MLALLHHCYFVFYVNCVFVLRVCLRVWSIDTELQRLLSSAKDSDRKDVIRKAMLALDEVDEDDGPGNFALSRSPSMKSTLQLSSQPVSSTCISVQMLRLLFP
jgi:hypothetical protein